MTETPAKLRPELQKAVALYYDGDGAPQLTAKGLGDEAQAIIELARTHNIPLCDNPALVELLSHLELGEQIPEALYIAVAHIVALAYRLRGAESAPMPRSPWPTRDHPLRKPEL